MKKFLLLLLVLTALGAYARPVSYPFTTSRVTMKVTAVTGDDFNRAIEGGNAFKFDPIRIKPVTLEEKGKSYVYKDKKLNIKYTPSSRKVTYKYSSDGSEQEEKFSLSARGPELTVRQNLDSIKILVTGTLESEMNIAAAGLEFAKGAELPGYQFALEPKGKNFAQTCEVDSGKTTFKYTPKKTSLVGTVKGQNIFSIFNEEK